MESEPTPIQSPYPWYNLVDDSALEQGDFLFEVPVIEPVYPDEIRMGAFEASADVTFYDVVILSQSCDLAFGKLENVLVCPHYSLTDAKTVIRQLQDRKGREDARRGVLPAYHVLQACELPGFESEPRIVTFSQVFTIPLRYAQALAQPGQRRLRMLPPYREHLAQAFARFVMRVGLPQDIAALD